MNKDNNTGLGFDKFQIITSLNTSSGKAKRGQTYSIVAGDKVAFKAASGHGKDWFITTTPILKAAVRVGEVKSL